MAATGYQTERLDHLGIVAEVCREIGLAASAWRRMWMRWMSGSMSA